MQSVKKNQIRNQMKFFRAGLSKNEVEAKSNMIFVRLAAANLLSADTYFIYASHGTEVKTDRILEELNDKGKKIYLPKIYGKEMQAELILDGHEHMDRYAGKESADVICFNFGYLPGGDHNLATTYRTSIEAIGKGLGILKHGGMMSLCIYSGGDTGFEEKEKILEYVKALPGKEYTVIVNEYYNRKNCPPMPVFIFKE